MSSDATVSLASSFGVTGLSALSTLLVAALCGPEVRGGMAASTLWLVVGQTVGFRGAGIIATRLLISRGPADPDSQKALSMKRRVFVDVPIATAAAFAILCFTGRLAWELGVAFAAAALPAALVSWNTLLLQSGEALRSYSIYRLVGIGMPQVAQLFPLILGFRSAFALGSAFLCGSLLAHPVALATSKAAFPRRLEFPFKQASIKGAEQVWLTGSSLLQNVAPRLDLLYLSVFGTSFAVGQYSLVTALTAIPTAAAYPLAVRSFRNGAAIQGGQKNNLSNVFAVLAAVGGMVLFTKFGLAQLIGEIYEPAVFAGVILCVSTLPSATTWVISERWRGEGRAGLAIAVQFAAFLLTAAFLAGASVNSLTSVARATLQAQSLTLVLTVGLQVLRKSKWRRN
jgi:hypothetical protein